MILVSCRCGTVNGQIEARIPAEINRVVCYCDDCQAFAHHLGRADLLDTHGGSDIVQVPPAALRFHKGQEQIAGVRLSPKGLHRWYAACCHTPLGNMVSPSLPFVGVMSEALGGSTPALDGAIGPPKAAILGQYAVGEPPPGSKGMGLGLLLRVLMKIFRWRLTGRGWPHPFFDQATRAPLFPLRTISREEREALRPLCGPKPAPAAPTPAPP